MSDWTAIGSSAYGIMRAEWDDATRTFTERDETGAVTLTRPYNDDENAAADWRAARAAEKAAREAQRATVAAIIDDLQAEKDRAQSVIDNASATPREKDLGRAIKRTADAAIDLARFVKDMA